MRFKFSPCLVIAVLVLLPACSSSPAARPDESMVASRIIDGDTIEVTDAAGYTEQVRLIGIDTPERGECGFKESGARLSELILNSDVLLVTGGTDNQDRYKRLLRYVDFGEIDAGLVLIQEGFAIARYDSRDGYPQHDRESEYVKADSESPGFCKS